MLFRSERSGACLSACFRKATPVLSTPDDSGYRCSDSTEGLSHIGISRASAVEDAVDLIEVVAFDRETRGGTG